MMKQRILPTTHDGWKRVLTNALAVPHTQIRAPPHFSHIAIDPKTNTVNNNLEYKFLKPPPTKDDEKKRFSGVLILIQPQVFSSSVMPQRLPRLKMFVTVRTSTLRTHSGEVAFPGGRLDPGETVTMAAIREAREEVGVDADRGDYEILGSLQTVYSVPSKSFVVPVVGLASTRVIDDDDHQKTPDQQQQQLCHVASPREVAEIRCVDICQNILSTSEHYFRTWSPEHEIEKHRVAKKYPFTLSAYRHLIAPYSRTLRSYWLMPAFLTHEEHYFDVDDHVHPEEHDVSTGPPHSHKHKHKHHHHHHQKALLWGLTGRIYSELLCKIREALLVESSTVLATSMSSDPQSGDSGSCGGGGEVERDILEKLKTFPERTPAHWKERVDVIKELPRTEILWENKYADVELPRK